MQNQKSQTYCGFNWYFYPGRCANGSISTQGNLLRLETKVSHWNLSRILTTKMGLALKGNSFKVEGFEEGHKNLMKSPSLFENELNCKI